MKKYARANNTMISTTDRVVNRLSADGLTRTSITYCGSKVIKREIIIFDKNGNIERFFEKKARG